MMKVRVLPCLLLLVSMTLAPSCFKEEDKKLQPIPKTTTDTPSVTTYSGQHLSSITSGHNPFMSFAYSNELQLAGFTNSLLPSGWTFKMQCSPLVTRIEVDQEGEFYNTTGYYQAANFVFDLLGNAISMVYNCDISENDKETGLAVNKLTETYECTYEYDTEGRMLSSIFNIKGEKTVSGTQKPSYSYKRIVKYNWKSGCVESVEATNDWGSTQDIDKYTTEFKYNNAPNMGNIWPYTLLCYGVLDYAYPFDKVLEPVYLSGYFGKFSDKHLLNAHYEHMSNREDGELKTESFDANFSFDYNSSSLIAKEYNTKEGIYYLYNYTF